MGNGIPILNSTRGTPAVDRRFKSQRRPKLSPETKRRWDNVGKVIEEIQMQKIKNDVQHLEAIEENNHFDEKNSIRNSDELYVTGC